MNNALRFFGVFLLALMLAQNAWGESSLTDPGIPDQEDLRYRLQNGDKESYLQYLTTRIQGDDGRGSYLITVKAEKETTKSVYLRPSFLPVSTETVKVNGDIRLTTNRKVEMPVPDDPETIYIFSFADLTHVLRGYPFDNPRTLKIRMINGEDDDEDRETFAMSVVYLEEELIKIGSKEYSCHHLELEMKASGAMRMLSFMIPDTEFWYSTQPTHKLIKFTGMGGGFGRGSDEMIMEIFE